MLYFVEPDIAASAHDEDELFAFVMIGAAAGGSGREAEEMRLHGGCAEGQQFELYAGLARQLDALVWTDEFAGLLRASEEGQYIRLVEHGEALQCCDGGVGLSALEATEEAYGEAGSG